MSNQTGTLAATLGVVVLGMAACSSPAASRAPDGASAAVERDGVRVTLTLEGAPASGVRTWARTTVENTGPRAITWAMGMCHVPTQISIEIGGAWDTGREWPGLLGRFKSQALSQQGWPRSGSYVDEGVLAKATGNTILCPASLGIGRLEPGASLNMRAAWDGAIADVAVPAGPTSVSASFGYIGFADDLRPGTTDTRPIVARVATTVTGSDDVTRFPAALAIDAALADPAFAAFLSAAPETEWLGSGVASIEGKWWISLVRGANDAASYSTMTVIVDQAGQVIAHRSG